MNKLLFFVCVVILMMFFLSTSQEPDKAGQSSGEEAMTRRSSNVVMVEHSLETGKTMEIKAREVVETGDQVARFMDFLIEQGEGPRLSGTEATYDRKSSLLTVHGPIYLEAKDGAIVHINGLHWDRLKNEAHTDNPVRLEGWGSIITADRAAFSDGFNRIALTGRVHAKIMQNILDL